MKRHYLLLIFLNCFTISFCITGNPEANMDTLAVIKYYGYPVETHEVTTQDGYILTLFRIPNGIQSSPGQQKRVVFLQHGLVDSSFTWVNNPPPQSLAFILADNGFDVWLSNSRGNGYSYKHTTYSNTSREFWDFSWDEMVKYDLDACVNYIVGLTGAAKIGYVGHSQGTEIAFAKLGQNGDFNSKISAFVALAPVAYLGNLRTVIKYLSYLDTGIDVLFNLLGPGEFKPDQQLMNTFATFVCSNPAANILCQNLYFMIMGPDPTNLNQSRFDVYFSHSPSPTSVKNLIHYSQSYKSNKFQYYDYGWWRNFLKYSQFSPPTYNLNTYGVPVAIYYGGNDYLADPTDVKAALVELGSNVKQVNYLPNYNHADFVMGISAAKDIYPSVINFLNQYK